VTAAGPGAKISRAEVGRILGELGDALRAGRVAALLASLGQAV